MLRRHYLSEREWKLVEPHPLARAGTRGGTGANRRFGNAVVPPGRTGGSWRALPERFGPCKTVARRFRRGAQAGVWQALVEAVQEPAYAWGLRDSTTVKAHQAAAGQKKARPQPQR
jgi:transposase